MQKRMLAVIFAMACSNVFATTIGEFASKQAELDSAEMEAKIAKAKSDISGPPAQPKITLSADKHDPSDLVTLNGIIGVGDDLRANVSVNNVDAILRKGDGILGWKAESISDYEAVLIKEGKGSGKKSISLRMVGAAKTMMPTLSAAMPGLPAIPPIQTTLR